MSNLVIVLIFGLSVVQAGLSMRCYATNVAELEALSSQPHRLQDCGRYLIDNVRQYGLDVDEGLLYGIRTSCYSINVNVKPGAPIGSFAVKGCVPTGYCGVVQGVIDLELAKRNYTKMVANMACAECNYDQCNL